MSRKEFDVEFVVRGRFAIDSSMVDEICGRIAADIRDENGRSDTGFGKQWLESSYGASLQAAVIDVILTNQDLLTGFLLDKGAYLAGECLGDEKDSAAIPGRLGEEEILESLANRLPPVHRQTMRDMIDDCVDLDANLPVLFDYGALERLPSWGCIEVSQPFKVTVASISDVDDIKANQCAHS